MIITLKDGSTKEYSAPMTVLEIAKDISEGHARAATAARWTVSGGGSAA